MAKEVKKGARRRAHNEDGTFKADDPSTPHVNEAFEQEPQMAKQKPAEEAKPEEAKVEKPVEVVAEEAKPEEAKKAPGVYVEKGKSVSTKVGIIDGGEMVPEGALTEERVKELIEKKALIVVK
jgi:hypothetical protein